MPLPIYGQVGAPSNVSATDGNGYPVLQGKFQELIVSELNGKYYTWNYRGRVWAASLTSATAMVAPATNATPNFAIWNPAGNNTAVVPIAFYFGYVSGTPAAATIGYSYIPNAGTGLGTAAPISAITALTPVMCNGFASYNGNVKAASALTVTGAAPSAAAVFRWSGISQGVLASASVPPGMTMIDVFDGNTIIPPNTAIYPVTSAASVATYMISAVCLEVPWP